jgi:hypothetical protein
VEVQENSTIEIQYHRKNLKEICRMYDAVWYKKRGCCCKFFRFSMNFSENISTETVIFSPVAESYFNFPIFCAINSC